MTAVAGRHAARGSAAGRGRPHGAAAHDARWALAAAGRLAATPLQELLSAFAALVDEAAPARPGRLVAILTGDCSRAPLKVHGGERLPAPVTSADLARLGADAAVGAVAIRTATVGGASLPLLVTAAAPLGGAGSLVAIELADAEPAAETVALLHGLAELVAVGYAGRATEPAPAGIPENLAVAQERARTIVELTEAHDAALAAVLAALRARDLDDRAARAAATDVAVAALIELRASGARDRALSEEQAGAAFERLRDQLSPIARYASATLELSGPRRADRALASELAHAARAVARGIVLVLLDQEGVGRIRVAWEAEQEALTLRLRDDGPGALGPEALAVHRTSERVAALDGRLDVDAVPGWGTTVVVTLPLAPVELPAAGASPLAALNAREREVLAELARGHRNREIAETLSITPHTVKFHVSNILRKLDVASRGEAAALARGE